MTLQLEISNPQDAELILNLIRRLNIPFKQKSAPKPSKSDEDERKERRARILNFKAPHPSSFDDELSAEADSPRVDMASAAVLLAKDYAHDEELTAFTALDAESFHEMR